MILGLLGCALRTVPHYEPVGFALDPVDGPFVARLPTLVEASVGSRRLRSWTADSGESDLARIPPEALYAVYSCSKGWTRGAELDLLVDVGRGPRPVTLRWTPDRRAELAWSDTAPPFVTITADALVRRTGIGGFDGEAWTEPELGAVSIALAHLSLPERETLRGVRFTRGVLSPRVPGRELAFFDPSTEPPSLWFFDLAFANENGAFVGPVDAPEPPGAMTALHEFGHVIADVPLRRAYRAYVEAFDAWRAASDPETARTLRKVARARYRTYRAWGRSGPVVEAWEALRAGRIGPSSYGYRNPDESFAEAFALYHLDPAALDRALPGAVAWFAAETHLVAAGLSGPPPEE